MSKHSFKFLALGTALLGCAVSPVFAAKPIYLRQQPVALLHSFQTLSGASSKLVQLSKTVDFNQTTHTRLQQMYAGHKVWGGDIVVHAPHGAASSLHALQGSQAATTMNGTLYQDLDADLRSTPAYALGDAQAARAVQQVMQTQHKLSGIAAPRAETAKKDLIVYVDQDNKAHWAYLVSYDVKKTQGLPEKPTYIMDAVNFTVYKKWDNVKTLDTVEAGGLGGNEKMGQLTYDGLRIHMPSLTMQRDSETKTCYLQNSEVTVTSAVSNQVISFDCEKPVSAERHKLFWDADLGSINGGYSPENDALFAGKVIKDMYQEWYNMPVLTKNGKPMMLEMRVHEPQMDNAFWDGQAMTFGDGYSMFYPLVSLGVGAHEISHGFTEQHSDLQYYGQSGGLNEAFSDMAAQAAEFYATGKNSWQIGPEIMKEKDKALRYMDDPTKDCEGHKPGDYCSIGHFKDYNDSLDVHYSSGLYNRVFYLLGTAKKWNTKKAFDVMVKANSDYWTSAISFADAACNVIDAAKDYKYDVSTVKSAFRKVGIPVKDC